MFSVSSFSLALYNNLEMWHTWCTQDEEQVKESTYINYAAVLHPIPQIAKCSYKQSIKASHKGNKRNVIIFYYKH